MPNPSPAFQFYPGDYLSDDNVEMMTLEEQGAYIRLLCHAWRRDVVGCLPNDPVLLASLSRLGPAWPEHSATILRAFETSKDGKMIRQKRLMREWAKQQAHHLHASMAGRAGANKRWHHSAAIATPLALPSKCHESANGAAIAQHGSSSYSSSSGEEEKTDVVSVSSEIEKPKPTACREGKLSSIGDLATKVLKGVIHG